MTTKTEAERMPWYDYSRLYSHNAVFNFVVGGRGIGKTHGAKYDAINDYLKKGHEFIYLRRYKDELTASRSTFFSDITTRFPKHVFRIANGEAQIATIPKKMVDDKGKTVTPKPDWETMGYFATLASAQAKKGTSYHRVRKIIFDEFIIEKGLIHYLPNEHIALLNFYNTVDRYRDEAKVLLLANSVSMNNPYFDEWDIRPDQVGEWSRHGVDPETKKAFIVVHFPDSEDFKNEVYKTRFGRFIADSEYAKYAVGNSFADAHNQLIAKKTPVALPRYNLELHNLTVSVWKDVDTGNWFVIRKIIAGDAKLFTTVRENMGAGKTYLEPNSRVLGFLRAAFNNGKVFFDEPRTRNAFIYITRNR